MDTKKLLELIADILDAQVCSYCQGHDEHAVCDLPDVAKAIRQALEVGLREEGICGFCNRPGADKIPYPIRWPGEEIAGTELVHAACEDAECRRAHLRLTDEERKRFLKSL